MHVAIIGAGVGGLSLALSLLKKGFSNIDVYESLPEVSELGVGINILPHAMKQMDYLGVLNELLDVSVETPELQYYTRQGQLIWREARGKNAGYSWPQISIHRGDLVKVLLAAVKHRLGENRIHTKHKLKGFEQRANGKVSAVFEGFSKEYDCLVGCDGIHSAVRASLYPDEGAPKWGGITMWRGVTYMPSIIEKNPMVIAGSSTRCIVLYPISKPDKKGKILMNWVVKYQTSSAQRMPKQDWVHSANIHEIPDSFKEFSFLQYENLINNAECIYKYPQVDRDPLPTWSFGNVSLLGDAAHPMYPSGSNGASQAILDAGELAQYLLDQPSISAAIKAYDDNRRPATSKVVFSNRKAGPERCIDVVEARAPHGFDRLDDVVSYQELKEINDAYKKIAGFEVKALQ